MKGLKTSGIVKFRSRIQNTLLFYYLFPILVIFILLGAYFYFSTERLLDNELGKRLNSIALNAASQIKPFHLSSLRLNDPTSQTAKSLTEKLNEIKKKNQISRIYVFTLNDLSLLDTDPAFFPGQTYEKNFLHRDEIHKTLDGSTATSFLFKNQEGQFMKSSFSPVLDEKKNVIAIVGVEGNATFFKSLMELERKLVLSGMLCMLMIVLVSIFLSKKIVNPIQDLVHSAQKIGDGHLDEAIKIKTSNELGFLGYVMDEMRRKIVERDQELQVMLRGIAHEVRNPLGGIELFAGILSEEVKTEQAKQAVKKIQREVLNLKTLVEEFLNFAKKPSIQVTQVDFPEFMDEIRLYFAQQLKNTNINFEIVSNLEKFRADRYHMERVFLNLIGNSIQAVGIEGKIVVRASQQNNQVNMIVEDSGQGIPDENISKIFDPFFTTKEFGNGLGLSFVQKIVQAHGGSIKAESELNKGTKMIITLPSQA